MTTRLDLGVVPINFFVHVAKAAYRLRITEELWSQAEYVKLIA